MLCDASLGVAVRQHEAGWGDALGELRDALFGDLELLRGEAPLVDGNDLLELEKCVGRREQRGPVWRGTECRCEISDDIAARERRGVRGQAVLAEQRMEGRAQAARVKRSRRVESA